MARLLFSSLPKEKIVKSKSRDGLQTAIWNHLVKGYEVIGGTYTEGKWWCQKMKWKY